MIAEVEVNGRIVEVEVEDPSQLDAVAAELEREIAPPTVMSELRSAAAGGIGRGLANAFGVMENVSNWAYRGITGREMPGAQDVSGQFREYVGEQYGTPQTLPGRMVEAPIRGAVGGLALPLGPLTPAAALASAGGETAAQATEEAGGGPLAQGLAGLVGGGGISVAMARREAASQAARRAAAGAGAGKQSIAERLAAERIARSGFGLGSMHTKAGKQLARTRLAQGIEALDAEAAARSAGELPVSTATTLERIAPNVTSVQRALARQDAPGAELSAQLGAVREGVEGRIAQGAALERAGAPAALEDAYSGVHDELSGAVDDAYRQYRKLLGAEPPPIAIVPLRRRAAKIVREAGRRFPSDALPNPTNPATGKKLLDDLMETRELSLKELEQLRRLATNSATQASRAGNKALARNWYELRNGVEDTLDHFATTGRKNAVKAEALRTAIGKRAELGRLFDEKHAASAMFDYDVLVDGMKKRVLGAKSPATEIQRIRMIIAQSENAPEATKALQSVTFDAVFGPNAFADITEGAMKKARNALMQPRNREVLDAAYGAGSSEQMLKRFERARRALSERVGTKGEILGAGSNVSKIDSLLSALGTAKSLGGISLTRAAVKKLEGVKDEQVNEALVRFFTDPEYAAKLLKMVQNDDFESFLSIIGRGTADTARPVINRIGEKVAEGGG